MSIGKYMLWGKTVLQVVPGVAGEYKGSESVCCKLPIKVKQAFEGQLYIPLV